MDQSTLVRKLREPRSAAVAGLAFGLILSAVLGSELSLVDAGVPLAAGAAAQSWSLAAALLGQFGARMAAVFTLAVSTAAVRLGSLPRWLAALGYVTGALLLLTPPLPRWGQLLFPF